MTQGTVSVAQAADSLFAALPQPITTETLEQYGLDVTPEAARHFTREVLQTSLFWVWSALTASMTRSQADRVMAALRERIVRRWDALGLSGLGTDAFLDDIDRRRLVYEQILRHGGSPIAVSTEVSTQLAAGSLLGEEHRPKLLALLIDLVPVDDLGEIAAEIQVGQD